jgi:hypothetical protein
LLSPQALTSMRRRQAAYSKKNGMRRMFSVLRSGKSGYDEQEGDGP